MTILSNNLRRKFVMEMPVQCECGKWMELNDSVLPPGKSEGETICTDCYHEAVEAENDSRWSDL